MSSTSQDNINFTLDQAKLVSQFDSLEFGFIRAEDIEGREKIVVLNKAVEYFDLLIIQLVSEIEAEKSAVEEEAIKNLHLTDRSQGEGPLKWQCYLNAIKKFENSIDSRIYLLLGHYQLLLNSYDNALSAYTKYEQICPDDCHRDTSFLYGLGICYFHFNAFKKSAELFHRIIYIDPSFIRSKEIYIRLGYIYKLRKNIEISTKCFKQALRDKSIATFTNIESLFISAHLFEYCGKITQAKQTYEKLLKADRNTLPLHIRHLCLRQIAWIHHTSSLKQQLSQPPETDIDVRLLLQALELDNSDGRTWYLLGRCQASLNRVQDAFSAYRSSIDKTEASADTWCSIGVLYQEQNQPMDALQAYFCAVQLDKCHVTAWANLGTLYETMQQYKEALKCYTNAVNADKKNDVRDEIRNRLSTLQNLLSRMPERFLNGPGSHGGDLADSGQPQQLPSVEEAWSLPIPAQLTQRQLQLILQEVTSSPGKSAIASAAQVTKQRKAIANAIKLNETIDLKPSLIILEQDDLNKITEKDVKKTTKALEEYMGGSKRPRSSSVQTSVINGDLKEVSALTAQERQTLNALHVSTMKLDIYSMKSDDPPTLFRIILIVGYIFIDGNSHYSMLLRSFVKPSKKLRGNLLTAQQRQVLYQLQTQAICYHVQNLKRNSSKFRGSTAYLNSVDNGLKESEKVVKSENSDEKFSKDNDSELVQEDNKIKDSNKTHLNIQSDSILFNDNNSKSTAENLLNVPDNFNIGSPNQNTGTPGVPTYVGSPDNLPDDFDLWADEVLAEMTDQLVDMFPPNFGSSDKDAISGPKKHAFNADGTPVPVPVDIEDKKVNQRSQQTQQTISDLHAYLTKPLQFSVPNLLSSLSICLNGKQILDTVRGLGSAGRIWSSTILSEGTPIPNPPNEPFPPAPLENLHPPTPTVYLENRRDAFSHELMQFCLSQPVVVIRGLASTLKLDLSLFSTKTLAEAHPEHPVEVRLQKHNHPDENTDHLGNQVWYFGSPRTYTTIAKYAAYQASTFVEALREEKFNNSGKDDKISRFAVNTKHRMIKFGTNCDLSEDSKWFLQLNELNKLPSFLKVCSAPNMLSHVGYNLLGMNTVQLYMKVPGSRTPGHQENNNFCSVNINIGPGDCEWFNVPEQYWGVIHRLCEKHNIDYLSGSWWPVLQDLIDMRIPLYRFIQKPGDLVWINAADLRVYLIAKTMNDSSNLEALYLYFHYNPDVFSIITSIGTVHWVQAIGWCNNIAWNVGPMCARQYEVAVIRYEYNRLRGFKSIVPMIHLSWQISKNVKITDKHLHELIKQTLMRSLAHSQLARDFVEQGLGRKIHFHGKGAEDVAHMCNDCECEVFNILFVMQHDRKYIVRCLDCIRKANPSLINVRVLCEYQQHELVEIYDNFQLQTGPMSAYPVGKS